MTDTHTHLYDINAFPGGPDEALKRANANGISRFILPNVNLESVDPLLSLHFRWPDCTYTAAGLHPCDATENWQSEVKTIMQSFFEASRPVAIGEVGIDLYWDKSTLHRQIDVFAMQIEIAREKGLPLIIHSRDAFTETLNVLKEYGEGVAAVFHSFTGSTEDVAKIREVGDYYFGINGVVTFKNAQDLRDALPIIGPDRILLETDSPYLAPVPYRGRRNESAYLPYVCRMIAETLSLDVDTVAEVTDCNANQLFRL